MKVGEQGINDLEMARRKNEDIGFTRMNIEFSGVLRGDRFEHADGCGADGDDARAGFFCVIHRTNRFFVQDKTFFMHGVVREIFRLDGLKRAGADVQCYETNFHAARANVIKNFVCKMQAGGGRGHRAFDPREDRLITFFVFGELAGIFAGNIWRKGNFANLIEHVLDITDAIKPHAAVSFGILLQDSGRERFFRRRQAGLKLDFSADARVFAGTHHDPPVVDAVFFEQKHFKFAAGFGIGAVKPGGNDTGIVQDQYVSGPQISQQIADALVFQPIFFSMQNEQARFASIGRGMLRDEFGGKLKIEIGGSHRRSFVVGIWGFKQGRGKSGIWRILRLAGSCE